MTRDLLRVVRGRLIAVGLLAAANLAFFAGVVRPAIEGRSGRQDLLRRLEGEVRVLEADERSRAAILSSRAQADGYAAGFPARARLLDVTSRVQGVARHLDLSVPTIEYRPGGKGAAAEGPLSRVTITMRVEGSYGAARRFVYELEGMRRYLVIEKLALQGRPTEGRIRLAIELAAYFR